MIDPAKIQADFPILSQELDGHRLVYLDSANTSLTPQSVVDRMNEYYFEYNANIHRGIYPLSEKATAEHELAREKVKNFINTASTTEIVFTRNATESINLVVNSWGRAHLNEGDTVVVSILEHHSNIVPWQLLQDEIGFDLHYLGLTDEGLIDLEELKQVLEQKNVKFVSLIHQSNALGSINPIKEIVQLAHQAGALTLVDGAQSVPHMAIDVQDIDSDFFVFTGHKLCGPTGIGVLHAKEVWLEKMEPFLGGGEMIRSVTTSGSTWNDLPYKFEAGTPNIAGAIGLGAAVDYLSEIGMENIHLRELELTNYALETFQSIPHLKIFGPQSELSRGATFSFELAGVHPHDIASILGDRNICVRAGNHCAQPLMEYLGVSATTRLSLSFYNSKADIDDFKSGINEVISTFQL